jgi:hypothetical protein
MGTRLIFRLEERIFGPRRRGSLLKVLKCIEWAIQGRDMDASDRRFSVHPLRLFSDDLRPRRSERPIFVERTNTTHNHADAFGFIEI